MQLLLLLFTRFLTSLLLGNPISRANPVQSGQGYALTHEHFPVYGVLETHIASVL
jgi:hypothetical protein